MKQIFNSKHLFWSILGLAFVLIMSCKEKNKNHKDIAISENSLEETEAPQTNLSEEFKTYWYAGKAEITSYKLEQARYGELRDGEAVLVYVTEDFLPKVQVKADNYNKSNIPVLKLNATKNFLTGIYPYTIMQSTFYPVANNKHAIKVSASVQEWCGHVYTQLNNRKDFEIVSHSYFETEADQAFHLKKTWTENELWTKLRIDPKSLPVGTIAIIPSLEFTRLRHQPLKAYKATASLKNGIYTLDYKSLKRSLTIKFNPKFPYDILGWEETMPSGFGPNAKLLTTKATKIKSIKSAYWGKNHNTDVHLRDSLGLK